MEKSKREKSPNDWDALNTGRGLSRQYAHEYVKLVVQTLFYLNAAALIVFPALAGLNGLTLSRYLDTGFNNGATFFAGLCATALAALFAYLALESYHQGLGRRNESLKLKNEAVSSLTTKPQQDRQTGKFFRASRWCQGLGFASVALAFLLFISGASAALQGLSDNSPLPASTPTPAVATPATPPTETAKPAPRIKKHMRRARPAEPTYPTEEEVQPPPWVRDYR